MVRVKIGNIQLINIRSIQIIQMENQADLMLTCLNHQNSPVNIIVKAKDRILIHCKCNIQSAYINNCASVFGSVDNAIVENCLYVDGKVYNFDNNTRVQVKPTLKIVYDNELYPERKHNQRYTEVNKELKDLFSKYDTSCQSNDKAKSQSRRNSKINRTVIEIGGSDGGSGNKILEHLEVGAIFDRQTVTVVKGDVNTIQCGNCLNVKGLVNRASANNWAFTKTRQIGE